MYTILTSARKASRSGNRSLLLLALVRSGLEHDDLGVVEVLVLVAVLELRVLVEVERAYVTVGGELDPVARQVSSHAADDGADVPMWLRAGYGARYGAGYGAGYGAVARTSGGRGTARGRAAGGVHRAEVARGRLQAAGSEQQEAGRRVEGDEWRATRSVR